MHEALLYRDENFGALAVVNLPEGIVTLDHGFATEPFESALTVLERHARPEFRDDGTVVWSTTSHRNIVLASLQESLERAGFGADPLAFRSAIEVTVQQAMNPDLPVTDRPARIHESVERGITAHLSTGLSAIRERGDVQLHETSHLPREATDHLGRVMCLTRARGLIHRPVESAAEIQEALREALAPVMGAVVRAAVEEAGDHPTTGQPYYTLEVALSPDRGVIEEFVSQRLPTFESHATIRGVRAARFVLNGMPEEEAIATLEERAVACTAATSIARPNGRTIVARIPSANVGMSAATDEAFRQRVEWVARQLDEWGPALDFVGDVEPVLSAQ